MPEAIAVAVAVAAGVVVIVVVVVVVAAVVVDQYILTGSGGLRPSGVAFFFVGCCALWVLGLYRCLKALYGVLGFFGVVSSCSIAIQVARGLKGGLFSLFLAFTGFEVWMLGL